MRNNLFILIILLFVSCNSMENHEKAQKDADYIVENLTNYDLIKAKLPEKYFQPAQTNEFINSIKDHCDWKNRKGKFVDYFTMGNIGGTGVSRFKLQYRVGASPTLSIIRSDKKTVGR